MAVARLKPVVSIDAARAELAPVSAELTAQASGRQQWQLILVPFREHLVALARPGVVILFEAVNLVLLIACANLASLLLGRGAARRQELAVRRALGARRLRIVRQLLTESVLLSLAGAAAGILLAWGLLRFGGAVAPASLTLGKQLDLNLTVLLYTLAVSVLTGLVFGLFPGLQASGLGPASSLKGGRGSTSGATRARVRSLLVVVQVALSLVLLFSAGLMLATFWHLNRAYKGFQPDNVITLNLALARHRYPRERWSAFTDEVVRRVGELPGVKSVGAVDRLPLGGGRSTWIFEIEGGPIPAGEDRPMANYRAAGTEYFQTLRIPVLDGRVFDERDTADSRPVAIINQSLAHQHWPEGNPLGRRIRLGGQSGFREIVGVVRDVRHVRIDWEAGAEAYVPLQQAPSSFFNFH